MKRYSLLLFTLCLTALAYSQPNNPVNPVPLDGGLSLLIAGAVALGYKYKKKDKTMQE